MTIGERITALRKEQNMSQARLADLMAVSRQAVSKWEKDQTSPDTLNLIRLAEVLNTEMEYLATGQKKEDSAEAEPVIQTVVKEVERIVTVETVVDRPIIRKRVKVQYKDQPMHILLAVLGGFMAGLLFACII